MSNEELILKSKAERSVRYNTIKNHTDIRDISLYVADRLLDEIEDLDHEDQGKSREMVLLNKLYKVIHSCIHSSSCYEFHEDWRNETKKMFKIFLKQE